MKSVAIGTWWATTHMAVNPYSPLSPNSRQKRPRRPSSVPASAVPSSSGPVGYCHGEGFPKPRTPTSITNRLHIRLRTLSRR